MLLCCESYVKILGFTEGKFESCTLNIFDNLYSKMICKMIYRYRDIRFAEKVYYFLIPCYPAWILAFFSKYTLNYILNRHYLHNQYLNYLFM
jgi:hypothetical protein